MAASRPLSFYRQIFFASSSRRLRRLLLLLMLLLTRDCRSASIVATPITLALPITATSVFHTGAAAAVCRRVLVHKERRRLQTSAVHIGEYE